MAPFGRGSGPATAAGQGVAKVEVGTGSSCEARPEALKVDVCSPQAGGTLAVSSREWG